VKYAVIIIAKIWILIVDEYAGRKVKAAPYLFKSEKNYVRHFIY